MHASFFAAVVAALAVTGTANGAVVQKRQAAAAPALTDADILNFALTLEFLEASFYSEALSKFTQADFTKAGYASNIRANIEQVGADESEHVQFLTTALTAAGATTVKPCQYKFPYNDVKGFLGLAQVIEGTGVSAYLGAARYIQNPDYLTAAAAILTVEARHNAFIRYLNGFSIAPVVDTPLSPTAVQSIATPFFVSCPDGSAPPFTPFPAANLTSANATIGSTIQVSYANSTSAGNSTRYCVIASGLETAVAPYTNGGCTIPSTNVTEGQAYLVIASSPSFNDSTVLAGPVVLNFDTQNNTSSGSASGSVSSNSSTIGSNAAAADKTGAASKTMIGSALGLVAVAAAALF